MTPRTFEPPHDLPHEAVVAFTGQHFRRRGRPTPVATESKTNRREVQRRLTRLGFGTKINGKFDDSTRDAIGRWQEEHAYPKTGFLNAAQHEALLSEGATEAGKSDRQERRRAGGRAHYSRHAGGPIGAIGGAVHHVVGGVVGLFRR